MKPSLYLRLTFVLLAICAGLQPHIASSQSRVTKHNNQYWVGYMTSLRLSEKYSLWNDFHLVPEGFGVMRTGITYHFNKASATGGYAFLWLPAGTEKPSLRRHEHRPWGQLQFNLPLSHRFHLTQRIRYDARFRENLFQGEPVDGFSFNHRVRFMTTIRRTLSDNTATFWLPYISVSDEVLLNFGSDVTYNTFDQNRLSLAIGIQSSRTQYQLGFMNRLVQTAPSGFTLNHTVVLWITQKFSVRRDPEKSGS